MASRCDWNWVRSRVKTLLIKHSPTWKKKSILLVQTNSGSRNKSHLGHNCKLFSYLITYFPIIYLDGVLPGTQPSQWLLYNRFPHQNSVHISCLLIWATCLAQHKRLDFTAKRLLGDLYKSWILLCNSLWIFFFKLPSKSLTRYHEVSLCIMGWPTQMSQPYVPLTLTTLWLWSSGLWHCAVLWVATDIL